MSTRYRVSIENPDRTDFPPNVTQDSIELFQAIVRYVRVAPGRPLPLRKVAKRIKSRRESLAAAETRVATEIALLKHLGLIQIEELAKSP